jgi:hypothetical protein
MADKAEVRRLIRDLTDPNKLNSESTVPALIEALSDAGEHRRRYIQTILYGLGVKSPSDLNVSSSEPTMQLSQGEFSPIQGSVGNRGDGPAFNLSLTFSGPGARASQVIKIADEVGPGATASWSASIQPQAPGLSVPLDWELTFDDLNGVGQKLRGTEYIKVSRPEASRSGITVYGDVLGPGATKQGEGVILQKAGTSQPVTPFGFCPSCGESLRLPETPEFCPHCGAALADEGQQP